ncbi:MAG: A/G-specific adenine glycosylase [Betaproteobacteria bacterium]|nr:A/G-specific adenine glycosylase [Betaproteobacteria bacterium]
MRPPRPASGSASASSKFAAPRKLRRDFAQRLIDWQRIHGRRDLPWQRTRDAYRIWLSEIMLQQTQVATVLPYYARFLAEFPDVDALARAPLARVLELWSGLGYYRRAHHLHAAARAVVADHDGRFPADAETLARLPGIGRSTAAAIAAFASGERGAILDGNVKRVLARHRGIDGWPGAPGVEAKLWRVAEALLPTGAGAATDVRSDADADADSDSDSDPDQDGATDADAIATYTQALMDLGATVCTRAQPRCAACPIANDCVALIEHRVDGLPSPRPRKPLPRREVRVLVLERDGLVLLEQRPSLGIWGGLWSLPEMPMVADPAAAIASRFGASAGAAQALPPIVHGFTHFTLTMHPLRIAVVDWPGGVRMPGLQWFTREAAIATALPAPIRKLLQGV